MAGLGMQELIIIFLIIIVLFGATRIPQIGKGLGEGIKNFKKGLKAEDETTTASAERLEEKAGTKV
jgi:sec-independent protein translocase protein TatA